MLRFCYQIALILVCSVQALNAQESSILWQKTMGGSGDDNVTSIAKDNFGNIYILGSVQSGGQLTLTNDIFITKMNQEGNTLWKKVIGGHGDEVGYKILVDSRNELVVLASSNSTEGYFESNSGYEDIYMIRYSSEGDLLNVRKYGGQFVDVPSDIMETSSGNYIISGNTRSKDGDITENFGQFDMWLLEVDYIGDIQWQKSYGASDEDIVKKVIELKDGNYMILGESASYDGSFADNVGDLDIVLIKIGKSGDIIWQRSYGGYYSEHAGDFVETDNGNVLVAGSTFSSSYDVTYNAGGSDVWLFEVDKNNSLTWEKTYGSSGNESIASIKKTNNGYLLLGTTSSATIQNNTNNGAQDIWLYELDAQKNAVNHALFGASGFESAKALLPQEDGTILMAGATDSKDGLVLENQGRSDGWLLKIGDYFSKENSKTLVHPNPSNGIFYLNRMPANPEVSVYSHNGQVLYTFTQVADFAAILDLTKLPAGMYVLTINSAEGTESHKLIVQ